MDDTFKVAVVAIPDISHGYRDGLQALSGADVKRVSVADTRKISGSVDIDECTRHLYPESPRWDYAIGYGCKVYFAEVHSASPRCVDDVVSKKHWLDGWLNERACKLKVLMDGKAAYWVASGRNTILKTSKEYRSLAKNNLVLVSRLVLE